MAQPSQSHGCEEARPWTWMANWLNCADARSWLHRLQDGVAWEQPVVRVYGRHHVGPRLTAFMAAVGVNYHYSGVSHRGEGLPDWLYPL
ncbi:MAG: alpha-ketoglutarate-dependent dioxygenase AlkB, partial [Prochlorococcus sp. ALOHA_A2.0_51]|nr:alpha-ketoglutarate-dependent dioxygenase AlkB [Prochlorococcus sp. ALOHA_A2.0_51]